MKLHGRQEASEYSQCKKKAFFSFLSLILLIVFFLEKPRLFVLISYFYVFYVSTLLHIHLKKSDAFIRL